MTRELMTDKEKIALYTMMKYPTYNDRQIAEASGLKLSTATAIRRRLREEGIFRTHRLPFFPRLGHEIISVSYGSMLKGVLENKKLADKIEEFKLIENSIYTVSDANNDLSIGFMKNYTEVKMSMEQFERFFFMHEPQPEGRFSTVLFPVGTDLMTLGFFDYSPVLAYLYGLPVEKVKPEYISVNTVTTLKKKERNTLKAMVENPELPDNAVAAIAAVSRQGASTMKDRFYRSGLLKQIRIPDLKRLGCNIIALTHLTFNPKHDIAQRKDADIVYKTGLPHFFSLFNSTDGVILSAHRSFDDYSASLLKLTELYREKEYITEPVNSRLLSIAHSRALKEHDYSSLISRFA